jgi:molybdopterin-guanine dinucleotide biosynthesis protein A
VKSALEPVVAEILLVANADRAREWLPGVRVVPDIRPERGSLVGLHTALASAAPKNILVVACDMPFVTVGLLAALRARLADGVFAVIPETVEGLHPFCAAYASRCLPLVEAALDAGELRMTAAIDRFPMVRRLGATDLAPLGDAHRLLFNVNTPDDLAEANRMARGT